MTHIIVSDLHGQPDRVTALLNLLHDRGWAFYYGESGRHPILHHDRETLVVAGDSSDRGEWSVPFAYLMASSAYSDHGNPNIGGSVVALMGNHDLKIKRYFEEGYSNTQHGFEITYAQLRDPAYKEQAEFLKNTVYLYPYWYVGKNFIAAHAYWEEPVPSEQLALYGPTIPEAENWKLKRHPWWEDRGYETKTLLFGHYHAAGDLLFPEKNIYCIDNHDAGIFTYAIAGANGVTVETFTDYALREGNPLSEAFSAYLPNLAH